MGEGSWRLIQTLVIKEIVALENKAKWHDEEHEEEDYSHTQKRQKYSAAKQQSYVMHYLFGKRSLK